MEPAQIISIILYLVFFSCVIYKYSNSFGHKDSRKGKKPLQEPPKDGSRIRIIWLPNPRNNPKEKNCYIGSEGIVKELGNDGSFSLNMGGGILMVTSNQYKYEYI